jgi:hypothetical protein
MMRVLQFGGLLPWKYKDTEYEKMLDPDGITTEFIRCPDPTDVHYREQRQKSLAGFCR